jgi:hypothetical protein
MSGVRSAIESADERMLTAARPADTPGAYADEPPSRSAETTTYSISAIGAKPNEELAENT